MVFSSGMGGMLSDTPRFSTMSETGGIRKTRSASSRSFTQVLNSYIEGSYTPTTTSEFEIISAFQEIGVFPGISEASML